VFHVVKASGEGLNKSSFILSLSPQFSSLSIKGGGFKKEEALIACNPFNMSHTLVCQYKKLPPPPLPQKTFTGGEEG